MKHVVIIGAGFAGLWAVKSLAGKKGVRVTLIDKNNYHTFLPLLYQVGAAEIEPEQIAYPIRSLLRKSGNVSYLRAEAARIDYDERYVLCNNQKVPYDYLIVASGSRTDYFTVAGAERYAFPLKTLDDAMVLRNHILTCFERAAYIDDPARRKKLLTFVIAGGGPTGVEFAGALSELVRGPLRKDFPGLSSGDVSVVLVESADRVLSMLSHKLSAYTVGKLSGMGVDVRLSVRVKDISAAGVSFNDGSFLGTDTVIWTAGVSGIVPESSTEAPLSQNRRIKTLPTLQFPGRSEVYVTGDLTYLEEKGVPLPMIAPVAIQQGRWAAENILLQIRGGEARDFTYRDRGAMVTIGRNAAVTRIGKREFRGFPAWIIWIVIHIMNLIGFRNKLFVIVNWIWDYLFFERSVRLILPGCCDNPNGNACLHRSGRCG
ncbi:MAG: NAD(P)/FAD-dependent oxidoreductase [Spirochaetes bacterium]|nr:NAD(P)/FAD-dependent oxidoreductase [Spirochaetota bacterium]